jgi:hypothetical protein
LLDKKGKGYADAKWEAEVRQKLTAKKAQVTLSKKDQALVNEQLQKEAEIRKRVAEIRSKLEHGLELVNSLASANVEEFRAYAPQIASILRLGAFGEASEALVGDKAFDTFLVTPFTRFIRSCINVCPIESERRLVGKIGMGTHLDCRRYSAFP